MHGNGCYVKLTLAALVACLLPSVARAEVVAGGADAAVLALGPDARPTVAYLDGRALVVTTRTDSGWRPTRIALPVPATESFVASAAVGRDGRPVVLVEDIVRRALVVVWRRPARWLVLRVARLPAGVQLGVGGLTLERRGTPAVAYAFRRPNRKTYLRLVRIATTGRATTTPVTQLGFPQSALPPSATPHVAPNGSLRIVEAYTSAVIDWFRDRGKWTGQYLFASRLGSPLGPVLALAGARSAVIAWTQAYPEFDESHVLVQEGTPSGAVTTLLTHARLSALTVADDRVEVAANDWVDVDGWTTYAGLLAFLDALPVELDARVEGYAAAAGTRQLLLATDRGLEWFSVPRPALRVSLAVAPDGRASGRVDGAAGGTISIYRDAPDTGRQLVAMAAVAPDGSYAARIPVAPTLYRAVYRDPATGVPYGALLRAPLGG
jgi:hypothetical protein